MVADFSAIEARVIAWLAGEQWVNEVFATHGKIYEATASQMFHVPVERIAKGNPEYSLRQKGKVATLALGYQGGVNSLISMGALNMGLSEEELPDIVQRWRSANRRICDLWYAVEQASLTVMQTAQPQAIYGLIFAAGGGYGLRAMFPDDKAAIREKALLPETVSAGKQIRKDGNTLLHSGPADTEMGNNLHLWGEDDREHCTGCCEGLPGRNAKKNSSMACR